MISAAVFPLLALFCTVVPMDDAYAGEKICIKCQVQQKKTGDIIGHVWGEGWTKVSAKKHANKFVPKGSYKRHCDPQKKRDYPGAGWYPKFSGGGGSSSW